MRILLVLATSTGGVGTHVRALAQHLALSHDVAILAPALTVAHFGLTDLDGVEVLETPINTHIHPRDWASLRQIRSHIEYFQPEIIHAHGFRAGLLTLLARSNTTVPIVVSWHNQVSSTGVKRWIETRVESFIATRADLTIGASTDLVDRARQVGATNAVFAPVAAPPPHHVEEAERHELRGQLLSGLDHGGLLGLAVGRVAPQKNYDLLISIAQRLRDVPINFCIAGAADDAVLSHLQNRIDSTDLGKARITFLGARSDITTLMAAADFYVLTSHWEARALVVQEALIAGLPIVASDVGGIPELVGQGGELVDPHREDAAEAFAQIIRSFLDPTVRKELSRKAYERGQELPTEADVAEIVLRIYRGLLIPRE